MYVYKSMSNFLTGEIILFYDLNVEYYSLCSKEWAYKIYSTFWEL